MKVSLITRTISVLQHEGYLCESSNHWVDVSEWRPGPCKGYRNDMFGFAACIAMSQDGGPRGLGRIALINVTLRASAEARARKLQSIQRVSENLRLTRLAGATLWTALWEKDNSGEYKVEFVPFPTFPA